MLVAGNTIINDRTTATGVWNRTTTAVTVQGNSVWGMTAANFTSGPVNLSGTTWLTSRPGPDTTSSWKPGAPPPDPSDITLVVPASESVAAGALVAVTGVLISDPWAATAPGA